MDSVDSRFLHVWYTTDKCKTNGSLPFISIRYTVFSSYCSVVQVQSSKHKPHLQARKIDHLKVLRIGIGHWSNAKIYNIAPGALVTEKLLREM